MRGLELLVGAILALVSPLAAQDLEHPTELVGTWRVGTLEKVLRADGVLLERRLSVLPPFDLGDEPKPTGYWWVRPRKSTVDFPELCQSYTRAWRECESYEWLERGRRLRVGSVVLVRESD